MARGFFGTLLLLLGAGRALGAVPETMPVQGTLRDNAGEPVSSGAFAMRFALYATEAGGAPLWSEELPPGGADCGAEPAPAGCVDVEDGVFSVLLGAQEPLGSALFANAPSLWLGLSVEGEPELPRRPLGSAGYAFAAGHAAVAGSIDCTACIPESALAFEIDLDLDAADLPSDGLDEVSAGVLTNQFTDDYASTQTPVAILDDHPFGVAAALDVPDVGLARAITVRAHVVNSDLSSVTVKLYAPDNTEIVLWEKSGPGTVLDAAWPPTAIVEGSLAPWTGPSGKSPKGTWLLGVIDSGDKGTLTDGQLLSWSLSIETLSTKKVGVAGGLQLLAQQGAPVACDARAEGTIYYEKSTKRIMMCDGDAWLRLRACDGKCPDADGVPCGDPVENSCGDVCGESGTGLATGQCLLQVSSTACNQPVFDACDNDCGLLGTAFEPALCPPESAVTCGTPVTDDCGNPCGSEGTACSGSGTCVSGECKGLGEHPGNPAASCKALQDAGETVSAFYWIDPDGPGGLAAASTRCDLDTAGGGFTLVATTDINGPSGSGATTTGTPSLDGTFLLPYASWFPHPEAVLLRYAPTGGVVTAALSSASSWQIGNGARFPTTNGLFLTFPSGSTGPCVVNGTYGDGYNCDGNSGHINGAGFFNTNAYDEQCGCQSGSGGPYWKEAFGGCTMTVCGATGLVHVYLR